MASPLPIEAAEARTKFNIMVRPPECFVATEKPGLINACVRNSDYRCQLMREGSLDWLGRLARIFLATSSPPAAPWFWGIEFHQRKGSGPHQGHAADREAAMVAFRRAWERVRAVDGIGQRGGECTA